MCRPHSVVFRVLVIMAIALSGIILMPGCAARHQVSVPLTASQGIRTTKLTAGDDVVAGATSISLVGHKHPVSGSMTGAPE